MRTPLAHGSYAGVFVGSFSRFFFAVCSCFFIFCFRALSLSFLPLSPIAYLLFPLFRPLVHDHNPQRADGSSRLCLRLWVSGRPCSIELSLTSDLKGIASSGYEIFLCKILAHASATLLSALSHHAA